ncbi:cytochrome P450 [Trematosphaeria pertusa]|uniref:Cytochrome P450 n=1 Tax=Trematosphaeria pertusa TaxID=390896 RepID=A0A6A6HR18_9PLEO|nr:cytochrome P450 [Trematosphaeria pertusa]KAF2240556.1 cytochrome P450 [Trematosphaeria pertusa]
MPKPDPQLPLGTSSTLRGLSETFSFHASPESFITSRILDFHKEHPQLVASRTVIRAKVLNRDVAVVSSHAQISQVLRDESSQYEACGAYNELMAPFFPSPNLLLTDGAQHRHMRNIWEAKISALRADSVSLVQELTKHHFEAALFGSEVDIYECMKTLSWKILLGVFLRLDFSDPLFTTIASLQEDLLRGQFSVFPVSINAGFWSSPRRKGVDAKKKLQGLILDHLESKKSACPFSAPDSNALEDLANHTLLITSSLATKAMASLLTALCLNLYLHEGKGEGGQTAAEELLSQNDIERCSGRLRSILLETERLSPPIVGIMRRSTGNNVISSPAEEADVLVPKGWDCWLYFVGGGRDPAAVGPTWDRFDPSRYHEDGRTPEGTAFGAGPKTCLGKNLVRGMALSVATTWLRMGLRVEGKITARGVRGWLGWERNDAIRPEDWAADMKQLPTQRPSKPVMVRLVRSEK